MSIIVAAQRALTEIDSPYRLLYGAALVLIIVYASLIPAGLRRFADSILGRIVMVGSLYGVIQALGWVYGLLTALAFLVLLQGVSRSPLFAVSEGFDGGGTVTEKRRIGRRWFVERVLGEHPEKIATDKVTTSAVQDA